MSQSVASEFRLRAATMADVEAATALINTCEVPNGESAYDPAEIAEEWSKLDLAARVTLVESEDGLLVGIMTVSDTERVEIVLDGYVHPAYIGRGIGIMMLETGELRGREIAATAPAGCRVVQHCPIDQNNQRATELMDLSGYLPVRRFHRMSIELTPGYEFPEWPMGILVRPAKRNRDGTGLLETVNEAFADHWSTAPRTVEDWMAQLAGKFTRPELWVQAFDGERRVAVAIGREYPGLGWIPQLCVLKEYRGRGLGQCLLQELFARFAAAGVSTVQLGVDTENATGATRLYERAGMTVNRTHIVWEKVLREGSEWTG